MELIIVASFIILSGFLVTFLTIPSFEDVALKRGVVSKPCALRSHPTATPLLGGLAIYSGFASVFLVCFTLVLLGRLDLDGIGKQKMLTLFLGSTWMLILGTLDDILTLGWKKKLAGQFVGAAILVAGGHSVPMLTIPLIGTVDLGWYGIPLFVVAVIAITNAVNLIDGLDGLAGGICFLAAITIGAIALAKGDIPTAAICFGISGGLLGFLMYNFPPASIFMGDGGSMMLGLTLGALTTSSAVWHGQRSGSSLVLFAFLPLGVPLFEVGLTILRRWVRGQSIFMGDRNHLHHRLLAKVRNPRITVAVFYVFSGALCLLTLLIVFEVQSRTLQLLTTGLEIFLCAGVAASIRLYETKSLSATLRRRSHFKFLVQFDKYIRLRLRRAKDAQELIGLLAVGVNDLDFDDVEICRGRESLVKWVKPRPVHPDNSRVCSEERFPGMNVSVKWSRPIHDDRSYEQLLMVTWYRILETFADRMVQQSWEPVSSRPQKRVVELVRRSRE
jgi:UDP-GlcNAc:undecaprenyl-phosphate/decaprenyl-phosphate GlcNAc-1-phosphate transferase